MKLKIRSDFPGASIGETSWTGDRLVAKLRREAVVHSDGFMHDYNHHFNFGISNEAAEAAAVTVCMECAVDVADLPSTDLLLFTGSSPDNEYAAADFQGRTDHNDRYCFRVVVPPGETVFVANYLHQPYAQLQVRMDELGRRAGGRRVVYGRSVQGRELVAYRYGDAGKPEILVTAGFHPPECDILGAEAVMEHLAGPGARSVLDRYAVTVVPAANPDAFILGYNGCNANEVNFYWSFIEHDEKLCPEAYSLWRFALELRPVLYFDFHAYTFQGDRRRAGPYLKPAVMYRGRKLRRTVRAIDAKLLEGCGGHCMRGALTFVPSTMGWKLTDALNTVTYAKYHLRLGDGREQMKRNALESVLTAAEGLAAGFPSPGDILRAPHGRAGADLLSIAGSRATAIWGLRIRPVLGRIKRRLRA